jgi:DNA-binding GntR family transcriptional regulator
MPGELLQDAQELTRDFSPRAYIEVNHRLHGLIASLIGNTALQSFWWQTYHQAASTWYRVGNQIGAEVAEALVAELEDINRALENGDVAAIGFIQRVHIGYGYQRIKTALLPPDWQEIPAQR